MNAGRAAILNLIAPGVRALAPYVPGKPIAELEREYGVRDIVKLASNENPLGASSLALAGLVGPLVAAVLMPVSSLTVVLSSAMTGTFARGRRRNPGPVMAEGA